MALGRCGDCPCKTNTVGRREVPIYNHLMHAQSRTYAHILADHGLGTLVAFAAKLLIIINLC
jgi:hypothetical protein